MTKAITCIAFLIIMVSCQKNTAPDPFEISQNKIGLLTDEIKINQLDSIYKNDSIIKRTVNSSFSNSQNEIEVYEKGGKKLLVLEPYSNDPTATIKNIQIIDARYHTIKGANVKGTFKNIKDHYPISKINNTLSTAVVFVDSLQAYFTIDKKDLPDEYQFNTSAKITAEKIPDSAKIKHFWISWDKL